MVTEFLFVVLLLCAVAVVIFSVRRGRKVIMAYVYIIKVDCGFDVETANNFARTLSMDTAIDYKDDSMVYCTRFYSGNQKSMIVAARKLGFSQ